MPAMSVLSPSFISQTVDTPVGGLMLVARGGRLCMAEFADCIERTRRWLSRRMGAACAGPESGSVPTAIVRAFDAYFAGDMAALDAIEVEFFGTAFQHIVWSALRSIPPGDTLGYRAFAERLGRPRAARAVGHANGSNPLSVVVPCHRLVGADGSLTNYGGGLWRKRWLLDHEARYVNRGTARPPCACPA